MEFQSDQIENENGKWDFHELVKYVRSLDDSKSKWIFRALGKWRGSTPPISSSFDDVWESAYGTEDSDNRRLYESWMLMDFKREAHHYLTSLPSSDDFLDWMSLARHYEMPTRLVDFTYSFSVAVYFALSKRMKCEDGCILAMNLSWLKERVEEKLKGGWLKESGVCYEKASFHDPRIFRQYAFEPHGKYVVPVNPLRRNTRLARQQGLFLCQSDIRCSFEKNLEEALRPASNKNDVIRLVKLPSAIRKDALRELAKMNIGLHTLYGDLSGWAESRRDIVQRDIPDDRFRMELERAIGPNPLI